LFVNFHLSPSNAHDGPEGRKWIKNATVLSELVIILMGLILCTTVHQERNWFRISSLEVPIIASKDLGLFYILSIDGGGIRGFFPAAILKHIETELKVPLRERFNMFAGTSTGSIIAAFLACGANMDKVAGVYRDDGPSIFSRRRFWGPRVFEPAIRSRYRQRRLREALAPLLGNVTLGSVEVPLVLPATDIGKGEAHLFRSGYAVDKNEDLQVPLVDAVIASCSAPTYFDPTRIGNTLLADGGLWANSPALAAVIEARQTLDITLENIRVLSLGTGHSPTGYGLIEQKHWGFINGWRGTEFIDFLMFLQTRSTHNYLEMLLDKKQFFRLTFESETPLHLDDCSIMKDLETKAGEVFRENREKIRLFLNG